MEWLNSLKEDFILNFVKGDRWQFLVKGLGNTLLIALASAAIGVLLGITVAVIRTTYDSNIEVLRKKKNLAYYFITVLNAISKFYLSIFRGTPVVVQLLIFYFIIFASTDNGVVVAMLAFGINSGAYVAEIIRGGIASVDKGQFEAGRSLGFNYVSTMIYIVMPQALKSALPALLNEFIALLKETSVAGYVGIMDLTKAGNNIRNTTYSAFMPLIAVALIYLVLVIVLTKIFGNIERRLRKSDH